MRRIRFTSTARRVVAASGLAALLLVVGAPLVGPPAGAATCADGEAAAFVCRAHASFARREATSEEIEQWAPQLPARRTSFVAAVARGEESRHQTVIAYHQRFGGTTPGPSAHAYWDAEIVTPTGLRRLEAALLANRSTTDAAMVETAYELDLGRAPGSGERAYWLDRIARIGRNRVASDIAFSPEARRTRVVAAFENELLYTPSAESRDYWAERLRTGTSYLDLRIALRSTPDGYRASGDLCAPPAPQTTRVCP